LKQDFVSRSKLPILSIFIYISTDKGISSSRFYLELSAYGCYNTSLLHAFVFIRNSKF